MRTATLVTALLIVAGCEWNLEPDPPPPPSRAVWPHGTVVRGPFYSLSFCDGKNFNCEGLDTTQVTIAPMDDVVYDVVKKQIQFRALGTYTITTRNETPEVSSTVTVEDGAEFVFDMEVAGNRDIYSATIYGFKLTRLTTDPGDDVSPSMAKGVLVFSSNRDGNSELYWKAVTVGGPDTRLTFTAANETEAQISPDGTRIAYVRDDDGAPKVWLSGSDGSAATRLTNSAPTAEEGHPRWYATSDYLLMTSTVGGGKAIYRSAAVPGSVPTPFAVPVTKDSVYDDPSNYGMRSTNFAAGGAIWIASKPGEARRACMAPVYYNGMTATAPWIATPATVSVGEPFALDNSSTTVFTRFMADGTTNLGYIGMTAPFPSFESIWHPIPLPGTNPRHASEYKF